MSIFMVAAPLTPPPTDAWRVRVEVDPVDWASSSYVDVRQFRLELLARYKDTNGNSPYDLVEVSAGGRIVSTIELFDPPRRTGPEGTDRNVPEYARGPRG